MKKTAFLTALLIGTSLSTNAMAEVIDSGTCGEDCYWEFNDDEGELHIYGSGNMTEYGSDVTAYPWSNYIEDATGIRIDEGIENIAKNAFNVSSASLTSQISYVSLPNSLTSIGNQAFYGLQNLEEITIPASASIGGGAFMDSGLTHATLAEGTTSIGNHAFADARNLESITIPDTVTTIEMGAFRFATNLENVTIPDSVSTIERLAFDNAGNLIDVSIGNSVTTIEESAFSNTGLISLIIPDSVTTIGSGAFQFTPNLESIIIGEGVTSMGSHVFNNSGIENLVLPESLFREGSNLSPYLLSNSSISTVYCPENQCENFFKGCTSYNLSGNCVGTVTNFSVDIAHYIKDEFGIYGLTDGEGNVEDYFISNTDMINGNSCDSLSSCRALILENKGVCNYDDCYDFVSNYEDGDKIKMNGKTYASLSDLFAGNAMREQKRIYTIEEATKASKPTGNKIMLRYK